MEAGRQRRREGREERQRSAGRDHPVACRLVWSSPTPTILLCSLPFPAPHLPLPLANPYRSFSLLRLLVLQVGRYDFDIVVSLLTVSSSPRWFLVSPSDNSSSVLPRSVLPWSRGLSPAEKRRPARQNHTFYDYPLTNNPNPRVPWCCVPGIRGILQASHLLSPPIPKTLEHPFVWRKKKKKRFELTRDYTFSTNYFLVYYTRERNGREWASNPLCH